MKVLISLEGGVLVAVFDDGKRIEHVDAMTLAIKLAEKGIQVDQVQMVDWHEDSDRAPSGGEKIAIYQYLRQLV